MKISNKMLYMKQLQNKADFDKSTKIYTSALKAIYNNFLRILLGKFASSFVILEMKITV
jgi:hypothetical protein